MPALHPLEILIQAVQLIGKPVVFIRGQDEIDGIRAGPTHAPTGIGEEADPVFFRTRGAHSPLNAVAEAAHVLHIGLNQAK
jgi:hypothetical protein